VKKCEVCGSEITDHEYIFKNSIILEKNDKRIDSSLTVLENNMSYCSEICALVRLARNTSKNLNIFIQEK